MSDLKWSFEMIIVSKQLHVHVHYVHVHTNVHVDCTSMKRYPVLLMHTEWHTDYSSFFFSLPDLGLFRSWIDWTWLLCAGNWHNQCGLWAVDTITRAEGTPEKDFRVFGTWERALMGRLHQETACTVSVLQWDCSVWVHIPEYSHDCAIYRRCCTRVHLYAQSILSCVAMAMSHFAQRLSAIDKQLHASRWNKCISYLFLVQ